MFEDLMADAASGRGADDHVISLTPTLLQGCLAGVTGNARSLQKSAAYSGRGKRTVATAQVALQSLGCVTQIGSDRRRARVHASGTTDGAIPHRA